jgi:hypothetical protein
MKEEPRRWGPLVIEEGSPAVGCYNAVVTIGIVLAIIGLGAWWLS